MIGPRGPFLRVSPPCAHQQYDDETTGPNPPSCVFRFQDLISDSLRIVFHIGGCIIIIQHTFRFIQYVYIYIYYTL